MRFSLLLLLLLSLPLLPQAKSETIRSPTRSGSHARGRAAQEEQSQWEFSSPSTEGRKRKKKGPELSARLQEAFGSRPVWSSLALRNVLASSREAIRQALPGVAYRMRDGPFKSLWVRRGFDPSSEPSSFMYQMYPLQLQRFEQQVASKLLGNKPRRSDHRLLEVPWRAVTMERLLLNASSSCRYFDEERGWLTDEAWAQIKAIIETRKFELLRVCSPLVASPRVSPMRKRSQQAIPSSPAKRTLSSPASPRGRTLASPSPSLPLLRALG
ncbi:hypothetical protein GUITHDRAFT_142515 [Guillardia theta CCMP2712]|uniref:Transcription factor IIIC subunit 5 HTH domain-containing protein n=1 Tax=Guillardia theta (strain CCMP2712) TaxID=905079 RepID=L1IWY9_GUITC|nr:hypothetical protein GUITHDRAFT_142515 [Guillardia theta CCMP2712]EKX40632.1 hypothetical protein GUITHDRAFT_142515 [Guillardia theta CCMP2712]|eukprot:XP_005827612.1 hypothetical protein GUITHDRAFT_142515 [Guillardia theta CCMP2712]